MYRTFGNNFGTPPHPHPLWGVITIYGRAPENGNFWAKMGPKIYGCVRCYISSTPPQVAPPQFTYLLNNIFIALFLYPLDYSMYCHEADSVSYSSIEHHKINIRI